MSSVLALECLDLFLNGLTLVKKRNKQLRTPSNDESQLNQGSYLVFLKLREFKKLDLTTCSFGKLLG